MIISTVLCGSHLACIFNVDVVDEFTKQPEIFLTARPQQRLLLIVLHLQTRKSTCYSITAQGIFMQLLQSIMMAPKAIWSQMKEEFVPVCLH